MKILLDECVTHDLRPLIIGYDVYTVKFMGWKGVKNGELLHLAEQGGFEAMITTDKAMPDQHNPVNLPFPVLVIFAKSDRIADVQVFLPQILRVLGSSPQAGFYLLK